MRAAALAVLLACGLPGRLPAQVLPLPARPVGALHGSQLPALLAGLSVADREEVIWNEVSSGNVPSFMRQLVPVTVSASVGGVLRQAQLWVTPDYVAVGSDTDFFRMPMTPLLAQRIADLTGCSLPTRKLVDAIWAQASVQLAPTFFDPALYPITSPSIFWQHHLNIEGQRAGQPLGTLLAGVKKDVVVSPLVGAWPGRFVIYGWHRLSGVPIQPLSKVHSDSYVDYSHGVRLVQRAMTIDGQPADVATVLADPALSVLLSDEGAFTSSRYPVPLPLPPFPLIDPVPATGPVLPWQPRFTNPQTVFLQPAAPGGDGFAVQVNDPAGGTDTIRLGSAATTDCVLQADIFCEYRPGLVSQGYERLGIFVRDNTGGSFDRTSSGNGACYALTWDSDDGRLRCARASGGVLHDLAPTPIYRPSTAWRRFRIEARGPELTFRMDGELLLVVQDATFPSGSFGIGYRESFSTNGLMRRTRADNVFVDLPDALTTRFHHDPALGTLTLETRHGVPGDTCVRGVTPLTGSYPAGPFFGIELSLADALAQYQSGLPLFTGVFDGTGRQGFTTTVPLPSGLTFHAVSLHLDGAGHLLGVSPPITFALP